MNKIEELKTKKKYKNIPLEMSIHLRYLHQDLGCSLAQLRKRYQSYSKTSIFRYVKLPVESVKGDGRVKKKAAEGRENLRVLMVDPLLSHYWSYVEHTEISVQQMLRELPESLRVQYRIEQYGDIFVGKDTDLSSVSEKYS